MCLVRPASVARLVHTRTRIISLTVLLAVVILSLPAPRLALVPHLCLFRLCKANRLRGVPVHLLLAALQSLVQRQDLQALGLLHRHSRVQPVPLITKVVFSPVPTRAALVNPMACLRKF